MQRLSSILRRRSALTSSLLRPLNLTGDVAEPHGASPAPGEWPRPRSLSFQSSLHPLGTTHTNMVPSATIVNIPGQYLACSHKAESFYSSEANTEITAPTDTVQEFYQKMLNSVEARTMPPNAWLWSLIANCTNQEDIKLLFQILQKIRIFRLSNLRIHDNFNIHLCMKVSEACARANALDYGLKSLWKHNVYGLTPTIGAAHHLLLHAKKHNDIKLMVKIMEVLKKNSLPLQPGTADIVFSICYSANKWKLISKYSRQFLKSGVKLHRAAFDIWMEFASKVGDAQAILDIEKLKYSCVKKKTLASGFSWAKGYLIDRKPESAASIVHLLSQDLSENNKLVFLQELQKLTTEWPKKMSKKQNEEDVKAMAENLKSDIAVMLTSLSNMGSDLAVDGELKC